MIKVSVMLSQQRRCALSIDIGTSTCRGKKRLYGARRLQKYYHHRQRACWRSTRPLTRPMLPVSHLRPDSIEAPNSFGPHARRSGVISRTNRHRAGHEDSCEKSL